MASLTAAIVSSTGPPGVPRAAYASVAEIDQSTGELYTPKKDMLSGGSSAAKGLTIRTQDRQQTSFGSMVKAGQRVQSVYETRFITYLARFLIKFDGAARAFWQTSAQTPYVFAEFSESVEIGLADYFVGPYGSYGSLSAMKAGINAQGQAKSKRYEEEADETTTTTTTSSSTDLNTDKVKTKLRNKYAKEGVLNLYTLLKSRYQSRGAKRQLAILFSFIGNPAIQPTAEIKSLLGEIDNASIIRIETPKLFTRNEYTSRSSSRRGGGYAVSDVPTVTIEPPPALGASYKPAKASPRMQLTSRILRIKVVDGGQGYTKAPEVWVSPPGDYAYGGGSSSSSSYSRQCQAQAIIDRKGRIDSIIVLDPGYGYNTGGQKKLPDGTINTKMTEQPPLVIIRPPKNPRKGITINTTPNSSKGLRFRQATANAVMEYKVEAITVTEKGNGYVGTDPPKITISPPREDPDWFVDLAELAVFDDPAIDRRPFEPRVTKMNIPKSGGIYEIGGIAAAARRRSSSSSSSSSSSTPSSSATTDTKIPITSFVGGDGDPLALLPPVRPELDTSTGMYVLPSISDIPTYDDVKKKNPRFRAVDPLFGAIGAVPVQKSATELKPNEYARLALSGAVCTVLVRTALNPLELIKTKLQLQNDEELLSYARQQKEKAAGSSSSSSSSQTVTSEKPQHKHQNANPSKEKIQSSNNTYPIENNNMSKNAYYPKDDASSRSDVATPAAVLSKEPTKVSVVNAKNNDAYYSHRVEEGNDVDDDVTIVTSVANATTTALTAKDLIGSVIDLRGPAALFQSADITFLASIVFGSLGFGATELFRRSLTEVVFQQNGGGELGTTLVLLMAATLATLITCAAASPFELLRVRSMGLIESQKWTMVMKNFLEEKMASSSAAKNSNAATTGYTSNSVLPTATIDTADAALKLRDYKPLWAGFGPTASRELAFAIPKFLAFDVIAKTAAGLINSQMGEGAVPIQVGIGTTGLAISAISGAFAGIAGAITSHPADLILTRLTAGSSSSSSSPQPTSSEDSSTILPAMTDEQQNKIAQDVISNIRDTLAEADNDNLTAQEKFDKLEEIRKLIDDESAATMDSNRKLLNSDSQSIPPSSSAATTKTWKDIVKEELSKEGGVANLYVGLTPRLIFFFLVVGLQFFLYDYVKNILEVGSDDLSLVLDVFYAVRQGLVNPTS